MWVNNVYVTLIYSFTYLFGYFDLKCYVAKTLIKYVIIVMLL